MSKIFANAEVGRKNIGFGIALFLLLGLIAGIPLTIDFFGGSLLTRPQYQTLKVVHGYGVFLSFVNYFFGLIIDRLDVARQQKEIASWSFLLAGLVGGVIRLTLLLISALDELGIYASLVETALFVLGTFTFVRAQLQERPEPSPEPSTQARYSHVR